jgi:hypothetical protein
LIWQPVSARSCSLRAEIGQLRSVIPQNTHVGDGTTWKQTQEAAKKAGYVISYQVLTVEPRGENDPDIYLVVTYKNWAALDGWLEKGDAISKQIEGSVEASNRSFGDRDKIRRTVGSSTMQVLNLK